LGKGRTVRRFTPSWVVMVCRNLLKALIDLVFRIVVGSKRPLTLILSRRNKSHINGTILDDLVAGLKRPLKVCLVRFDGLGDIALTLPLLERLEADPRVAAVTSIFPSKVAHALSGFYSGKILEVIPVSVAYRRRYMGSLGRILPYTGLGALMSYLKGLKHRLLGHQFDLVLLPRWDHDLDLNTRFFARGLGGKVYGHNPELIELSKREGLEVGLMDYVCESPGQDRHEMEHLSDFADGLGVSLTRRSLKNIPPPKRDDQFEIFLQTDAGAKKREWPIANWIRVFALLRRTGLDFRVIVNCHDDQGDELTSSLEALGIKFTQVNKRIRGDLYNRMVGVNYFLGLDTGPMHLAEFLGIPNLVVSAHPKTGRLDHVNSPSRFGNSEEFGVWVSPQQGLEDCQSYCDSLEAHCITQISAHECADAFRAHLARLGIA
jgi:ADP-heptose:LPS heptosyltransferase